MFILPRAKSRRSAAMAVAGSIRGKARTGPRCERPYLAALRWRPVLHDEIRSLSPGAEGREVFHAGVRWPLERQGNPRRARVHQVGLAAGLACLAGHVESGSRGNATRCGQGEMDFAADLHGGLSALEGHLALTCTTFGRAFSFRAIACRSLPVDPEPTCSMAVASVRGILSTDRDDANVGAAVEDVDDHVAAVALEQKIDFTVAKRKVPDLNVVDEGGQERAIEADFALRVIERHPERRFDQ